MPEISEMMAAYAEDAVEYAGRLKKQLDYSEESIRDVEQICSLLHKAIPKNFFQKFIRRRPSEEMFSRMSKMLGGYIGEVLIRHHGGNWKMENMGEAGTTIFVETAGIRIFPVGKVYKRISDGPADNIEHFFQVLIKEITNREDH